MIDTISKFKSSLCLHVVQKALQMPLFSFFFFATANLDGLTKVACQIFYILS